MSQELPRFFYIFSLRRRRDCLLCDLRRPVMKSLFSMLQVILKYEIIPLLLLPLRLSFKSVCHCKVYSLTIDQPRDLFKVISVRVH
jgi:hypothetical protein